MSMKLALAAQLEVVGRNAAYGSPPSPATAAQYVHESQGDALLMGMASDILGHAQQHCSEHSLAQAAFFAASAYFKQAERLDLATNSLILLGNSHLLNGEPIVALDHWSDALQMARELKDLALCAKVYLGIGQVYIGFGDDETSLRYNKTALQLAVTLGDSQLECEAQLYVASDCFRLQRYSHTMTAIDAAEKLLEAGVKNKVWSAQIMYFRGLVHAQRGQYVQAQAELATAYDLSAQNDNLWGRAHAQTALGEVQLKLNAATTESTLLSALALSTTAQLGLLQQRCSKALISWYVARQQDELALPYYPILFAAQDEVTMPISAAQRKRIEQLETRSRIEQLRASLSAV